MELNVSKDQAVPRLSDFMTKDEKMINEKLMQNDAELQDAMNRDDIMFSKQSRKSCDAQSLIETEELDKTRNKLNKWFPAWYFLSSIKHKNTV